MKAKLILTIVILFTSFSSFCNLIYVDINPDTTISTDGGVYKLDMNSDGIYDYIILLHTNSLCSKIGIRTLNDSCFISGYNFDGDNFTKAYNANDTINNSTTWYNTNPINYEVVIATSGCTTVSQYSGDFLGTNNKCLALKFKKNGVTYFCWLRIDVDQNATWFRVKDFAYDDTPIVAGNTKTTSVESKNIETNIRFLDEGNTIRIQLPQNMDASLIRIYNLLGCEITKLYFPDFTINKSKINTGIFMAVVETQRGVFCNKLYLNKD